MWNSGKSRLAKFTYLPSVMFRLIVSETMSMCGSSSAGTPWILKDGGCEGTPVLFWYTFCNIFVPLDCPALADSFWSISLFTVHYKLVLVCCMAVISSI